MEKFTRILCELFVKQNLSLVQSLRLMTRKSNGKIKQASVYLMEALESGVAFSNALKKCPFIEFDNTYITFILLAEKIGNMKNIIQYLDKKCKRSIENKNKMVSAIVYPVFVIVMSFFTCFFLCSILEVDRKEEIFRAFFLLFISCLIAIFCIYKLLGNSRTYEAFLGADLLVKEGISLSIAATCGAMIAGIDTKVGKAFLDAKEKLEYGMDLKTAFSTKGDFEDAFYYADITGVENNIFEKVAVWFGEKNEKRRCVCLQLIEPVFIAITGCFLLLLILNFFLPVINDMNWL